MDALTAVWRTEAVCTAGRGATRGQAAVGRLDALQGAVATHLATLGAALEGQPLTRLLQTAAEVPQAAAGVYAAPGNDAPERARQRGLV